MKKKMKAGTYNLPPITIPKYNFTISAPEFQMNGEEFFIWFLVGVLEKHPDYYEGLMHLGNIYTEKGMYEEGLKIDLKLAKLKPSDSLVQYNLACSYSLLGNIDAAVSTLKTSVTLGYKDIGHIEQDRDLANIRTDERYLELIRRLKAEKGLKKGK